MKGPIRLGQRAPRLNRQTLEGGIRVPFAVQWKGKLPAGKVYDQPVIPRPPADRPGGRRRQAVARLAGGSTASTCCRFCRAEDAGKPHDYLLLAFCARNGQIRQDDWKAGAWPTTTPPPDQPGQPHTDKGGRLAALAQLERRHR